MGSLLSNFAPIIEIIKMERDKIAERIQKKQKALIFKNIIFSNRKLNTDEAQEIKNISHHISLFSFALGEVILRDRNIESNKIDE